MRELLSPFETDGNLTETDGATHCHVVGSKTAGIQFSGPSDANNSDQKLRCHTFCCSRHAALHH